MKKENLISEEVALNELEHFIGVWVEKPVKKEDLPKVYPHIYEALISGNLVLEKDNPIYTMVKPFEDMEGQIAFTQITFKTRISPLTAANLAKGINLETDELNYGLELLCYVIDKNKFILDKFRQKDYATVREIASLFMNAG